ncbi:Histidinol-phosphate aminotransferase [Bienertia sinuspersici]
MIEYPVPLLIGVKLDGAEKREERRREKVKLKNKTLTPVKRLKPQGPSPILLEFQPTTAPRRLAALQTRAQWRFAADCQPAPCCSAAAISAIRTCLV